MKAVKYLLFFGLMTSIACKETTPQTQVEEKQETYNGIPISKEEPEGYTGEVEVLYKNGLPKMKGFKRNGMREGRWQSWHPTGSPASECDYKEGKEHGEYIVFHESTGEIMITGQYEEGTKIGNWKFYNEEGKLVLDTLMSK